MKSVSLDEQETTINFCRDTDIAAVYTSDTTVMTKLDRKCREFPDVYRVVQQDDYGKWYEFPKSRIGFKPPARELSERQRENLRVLNARGGKKTKATSEDDTL